MEVNIFGDSNELKHSLFVYIGIKYDNDHCYLI